jgi:L-fuculose-phosphate aldolase
MSDVIIRDKAEYHTRTSEQMERHLPLPPWSLRQKIALTCRILAADGHESALAGQITARGERPGTYWMLSFGLGFDEARASNIVLVDDDLNLIEGEGMVNPSNRFHLWIYRHRPEVTAIVHTHPPYCSALSVTGQPLVAARGMARTADRRRGRPHHSRGAGRQPRHLAGSPRPAGRHLNDRGGGGLGGVH